MWLYLQAVPNLQKPFSMNVLQGLECLFSHFLSSHPLNIKHTSLRWSLLQLSLFLQIRKTCQIGKPRSSSSSWRQFFLFLKSIDHLITLVSLILTNNVILFLNPQDPKPESQTVTWTLILAWQFFQLLVDASTLLASINYGYKVNSSELNWSEYDLLDVPINGNDLNLTQLTSASFIDDIKKRLWKG